MTKPCPYCGQEPLMYKGKKSGELWVHCHNGSYKGTQGVECPIADHNFTVDEWNYRPHEEKLLKLLASRSAEPSPSDVSVTQDVLMDIKKEALQCIQSGLVCIHPECILLPDNTTTQYLIGLKNTETSTDNNKRIGY